MKDWVSGEEVTYQYDALKRLTSAATTGPEWGLSFSFDGFGNRTAQTVTKGSAPSSSLTYNMATNRLTGGSYAYDANGNLTLMPGPGAGCALTMTYDEQDRLETVNAGSCGSEEYAYGPDARRVWKKSITGSTVEVVYLYGAAGERLGTFVPVVGASAITFTGKEANVYFAGRLVTRVDTAGGGSERVFMDRLGSVAKRGATALRYFPYGEEKGGTTTQERDKYGTYFRDAVTNLDYAHNRYFSSTIGRFLSADPYGGSGTVKDPQSWNRYGYVQGDPVNGNDPGGLTTCTYVTTGNGYLSCDGTGGSGAGWGSAPSSYEVYGQGNALGAPGTGAGQAGPGSSIGTTSPDMAVAVTEYALSVATSYTARGYIDPQITEVAFPDSSNSASIMFEGPTATPAPPRGWYDWALNSMRDLPLAVQFSVAAPLPPDPRFGGYGELTYIPQTGQGCASIGMTWCSSGAAGFSGSLYFDPLNSLPNIIPGFSFGVSLIPPGGPGVVAVGSYPGGLVGGVTGSTTPGVCLAASYGACTPPRLTTTQF
ncbi:MAG: RHS repeat-associated core domain-containing protein [Bryobacteraceae bacterium]|nr:RHS repeat-associated core domain-containing protein [Bryobacteraceae bacterium]